MAPASPVPVDRNSLNVTKLCTWWIVLLVATGGTLFGLAQNLSEEPKIWWLLYLLPPLALAAAARARRQALQLSRPVRVAHGLLVLAIIVLTIQFARGQWQLMESSGYDRDLLHIAIVISLISSGFLWLKRARPGQAGFKLVDFLRDSVWTAACAALVIAASIAALAVLVGSREREAQRLWRECGRPMDQFAAQMSAVIENESLRALKRELSAFGVQDIYRKKGAPASQDRLAPPKELLELIPVANAHRDAVVPSAVVTHYLEERADALANLYRGVLNRTPPLWSFEPSPDNDLREPNFLVVRKLSQIVQGDALERIRQGDDATATGAVSAGLRITESLGHYPTIVAQMIRCAVEALFVSAYARLQTDPGSSFDELAGRDCEETREDFRKCCQADAWSASQRISRLDDQEALSIAEAQVRFWFPRFSRTAKIKLPVPKGLVRFLVRLDTANASIATASAVRVMGDERNLSAPYFGMKAVEPTGPLSQSRVMPNCAREWSRLNASLLLREEAEIIRRLRRATLGSAGEVSGEFASRILPGTRWTYRSVGQGSVILKLETPPAGLFEVAPMTFFLSPIDGSAAWQFAPRATAGNSTSSYSLGESRGISDVSND